MTACEEYYRRLYSACGDVLLESFREDQPSQHAVAHQFVADLEKWLSLLANRPESCLISASISEYQFALLAVVLGQYRQSFMSLRLSFELLLGAVFYSAHELDLRLWLAGKKDLNWSAIVHADSGVYSKDFVGAFWEELADSARQYGAIAQAVYRECSEYVHGNAHTHSGQSGKVFFDRDAFRAWHEKAKSVRLASSYALCARYLRFIERDKRAQLESILLDHLGHIEAVRAVVGAPVEPTYV
jgi:hypothetical protein